MFSNLPIDVLFWLIVCVFLIGLYFWSIHNKFKIYNKSEEVAGSILMELEPSKKTQLYRRIELIVSILLAIGLPLSLICKLYVPKQMATVYACVCVNRDMSIF